MRFAMSKRCQISSMVALTSFACVLGSSVAARADVSTDVSIEGGSNYEARGYNLGDYYSTPGGPGTPGNGDGVNYTYPGDTGLFTCGEFSCGSPFPSVSTTGTTATTSTAVSAYDNISGSNGAFGSAYATASANNATGILRESAFGTFGFSYGGEDQYDEGAASAALSDNLTFTVAGAQAATQTYITLDYSLKGSMNSTRDVTYGYQNGNINYLLELGSTTVSQGGSYHPGEFPGPDTGLPVFGYPSYCGSDVCQVTPNDGYGDLTLSSVKTISDSPLDTELQIVYQLTGSTVTAGFFDGLELNCGDGVTCDYLDTSKVDFVLPTGVSLTSTSGNFLTAAVPEPSTWAMLLVGFSGIAFAGYRRRAARLA